MNGKTVLKALLFSIIFPGGLGILIPFYLSIIDNTAFNLYGLEYIGILIFLVGLVFYLLSSGSFLSLGGTPQIFFMKKLEGVFGLEPDQLANTGIYTFSRNPMYTGVVLSILGIGIFFESFFTIIYGTIFFLVVNFVVIFIEEPHLKETHGEDYKQYLKSTPRWLRLLPNKNK